MDPKETREKAVRDAKSTLILDAALRVFSQNGFHNTRLEDIAAAAGFSKAALYNYYENKEAIFLSLAVRQHERLLEMIEAGILPERPIADNISTLTRTIIEMVDEHFSLMLEISDVRCLPGMEFETLAAGHDSLMSELQERMFRMGTVITRAFAAARQRGEFESPLSDSELASMVGAQIRGVMFDWKLAGAKGEIGKDIERVIEFTLYGIRMNTRST